MKTDFDLSEASVKMRLNVSNLWGKDDFFETFPTFDQRIQFQPPANDAQILRLKDRFGNELPLRLESFLRRSNGVKFGEFDWLLLEIDEIIRNTDQINSLNETFPTDHLMFVGSLGDGDMFAYAQRKCGDWDGCLYWWEHEGASLYECASNIHDYLAAIVGWWQEADS